MKLIYIKSTMEPKNYSTLRSLLKQEQGEKVAANVFKVSNTATIQAYLRAEKIIYEVYLLQEEPVNNKKIVNKCPSAPLNMEIEKESIMLNQASMQTKKRPRSEDKEEETTSSKKRRRDED